MSRIGKQPIIIPQGVSVQDIGHGFFVIKGQKGELKLFIGNGISTVINNSEIVLTPVSKTKKSAAMWGLMRALLANAVRGVNQGFEKKLQIEGIGFKGEVKDSSIMFNLGFSHPVKFILPPDITVKIEKNIITIFGANKYLVGETAAKIRALKKPEPYKGKGIRYIDEIIKIKAGKKAVSTAG